MSELRSPHATAPIEAADATTGFSCGERTVTAETWPSRMFLPIGAARAAFED